MWMMTQTRLFLLNLFRKESNIMKRTVRILPLVFAVAIIFAGCIGKKNKGSEAPQVVNTPAVCGTLNLASYTPDTLNPLATKYSCVRDFLYLAYEGLFIVNEDLTVKGVLATDYSVSEDGTVYTVNLKKDVKFHDSTPFTSADVVATLDYLKQHGGYYSELISNVASYSAKGDYSVEITLSAPSVNFACNLDFPILPSGITPTAFTSSDFKINGTGRYKYKETSPYIGITLTVNDTWHKNDGVYIKDVFVRFLNDNEALLHAFNSGETDMITTHRGRWGEFSYTGNFNSYELTSTEYVFVGINTDKSAFSDVQLRKSLASLIDKDHIADTIMFSHATVADTPISAKAYFYRGDSETPDYDGEYIKGQKETVFILFNEEDAVKEQIANYVKSQLETAGVKAELTKVDYETYVQKVNSGDYQLYIGQIDMKRDCDIGFMFNTAPKVDVPTGDDIVVEVGEDAEVQEVDTSYATSGISDYTNSKLDDIITNLNSGKDADSLKLAYNNLKKFYDENLPQIPLFHKNEAMFVNSRIKGKINPNLTNFYADIGTVYILEK